MEPLNLFYINTKASSKLHNNLNTPWDHKNLLFYQLRMEYEFRYNIFFFK
jgi:hypothetical protein